MTGIVGIDLGFDTCYVLKASGVIVIDAGQPKKGRAFLTGLERASIQPDEVRLILLTHAHWDHLGSAAHEKEVGWVEQGSPPLPPGVTPWGRTFMAVHRLLMPLITVPPARVDRALADEVFPLEEYGVPGVVVPTPGHSPARCRWCSNPARRSSVTWR